MAQGMDPAMRRLMPMVIFVVVALVVVAMKWEEDREKKSVGVPPSETTGSTGITGTKEFVLCWWNVENFFDDVYDHRTGPGDREMDEWFAENPAILDLKLSKLSEAILGMNGGKGPDILAIGEVESVRAAELLKDKLNEKIADPALHYQHVLMKEISQGRHIAPAILTRLPVEGDRTRKFGTRFRVVEGHIIVDGHDLIVLASHWTSRLNEGSDKGRGDYADLLYGTTYGITKNNPAADVIICGDFNDNPDDVSVTQHLHAGGDISQVQADPLRLFDLMANKTGADGFGTHYYRGSWMIFDQLVVTPGMLDNSGWSCVPSSVHVVNSLAKPGDHLKRPWHFGNEKEKAARGYSDHFPVTVTLKVNS